jgi:hypothetical protein
MSARTLPNPDKPVEAKRKSRFSGEPKKNNHESTKGRKHERKIS